LGPPGHVLNVYEAVDILSLIKSGTYDELTLSVGEALLNRPEEFPGVHTCSENDLLASIFDTIRRSRVHRLVVLDGQGKLKGMVSLSDILGYILKEEG
jgi:5'-AMP-activated protein kinase, regulatory gamma subunit